MTTLSQRAVTAASGWLSARTSRRGFLARTALVGSALTVDGFGFVLKPQSAYASVCGPGSSCASGWTVFCATINKGVNACPPGSIAAGWWKADGASLCGGKARYIIDCNAACSRCASSGRAGLCPSQCWSCKCGCGPAGQCDNRRVCCNNFRYGQCNQQVRQVGAVQCRVVSCIPPWTFAKCTTSPATDNATRDHSSPALPSAWTPITGHYQAMGERLHKIGPTVYGEFAVPGGRAQRYVHGRISQRTGRGAKATYGPITSRFMALGGEAGLLGFPATDELSVAGGAANAFDRGRVSWHGSTGAWETVGAVTTRYQAAGLEAGRLGFPKGPCFIPSDGKGRVSAFQRGRISWHPSTGARLLGAALAARYVAIDAEEGALGYPTADEFVPRSGVASATFVKGRMAWSAATGAWELLDVVAEVYVRSGAEVGPLGLPVAAEEQPLGGRAQRFQTGRVSVGPQGGFFTRGPITDKYVEMGAENGALGWPKTDEFVPEQGKRQNDFDLGNIVYDEATGVATATILA